MQAELSSLASCLDQGKQDVGRLCLYSLQSQKGEEEL